MIVTGILALATGLAYTALGVITVHELIRHRRDRGFSHFGLSFAVMAFTCGPHHLVHAYRHLVLREPAHGPMQAAMAIGAVPAVVFIALRLEAAFGGRGDRLVRNSRAFELLPLVFVAAAGATVWEALRHTATMAVDLRALLPNIVLFVNYALVGLPHVRHVAPGGRAADRFEPGRRALRQRRRSGVDLLHVGRLSAQQGLRARLEPPPAGRPRRPARSPLPVGGGELLNSPAPYGASQSRVAFR